MGSKPSDKPTMNAASAGGLNSAGTLTSNAATSENFGNAANSTLFGTPGSDGKLSGGNLSPMLDPNSLKVDQPTGTYGLQYKRFQQSTAKNYQDAQGSLNRDMANRGINQSGVAVDESRKLAQGQADTQGAGFTDYAGKSYQDALDNFWKANLGLSDAGAQSRQLAEAGNTAAAGTYNNLYNTAAQPRPSALGSIIGGGLSAGGSVGNAAVSNKSKPKAN